MSLPLNYRSPERRPVNQHRGFRLTPEPTVHAILLAALAAVGAVVIWWLR